MDWVGVVRQVAGTMKLLDAEGRLKRLDSMMVIDFVLELETAGEVEIPMAVLREEVFKSVESVATMLSELEA